MFVVEDKKGKKKAQELDKYVNASSGARRLAVIDSKGKKIIKSMDKETFDLKFG